MRWIDCLCLALGLKENDERQHGTQSAVVAQPAEIPHSVPRIQTPQQASPQTSSQLQPSPQSGTRPITRSSPNMAPHSQSSNQLGVQGSIKTQHSPSISKAEPRKSEVYFPLEDSYTGERLSTDQDQIGGGLALSEKDADHRASLDSIPTEPPPVPPKKVNNSGPKLQQHVTALYHSFFDNPKKSYINLDDNENVYNIPHGDGVTYEGTCLLPRGEEVPHTNDSIEEGIYMLPHGLDDGAESDNGLHQVHAGTRNNQPTQREPSDVFSSVPTPGQGVLGGVFQESQIRPVSEDLYDIPPTQAPPIPTADKSHRSSLSSIDSHEFRGVHGDQNEAYGIPKHLNQLHTQTDTQTEYRTNTIGRASKQVIYDAPKSFRKVSPENNILGSIVPPPDTTSVAGQVSMRYENLSPEEQTPWSSHLNSLTTNTNSYVQDIYDRPPPQAQHVSNKLVKSLPLPKDCNQPSTRHSYINMPHAKHDQPVLPNGRQTESFYISMAVSQEKRASKLHEAMLTGAGAGTGMGQVYTDMKSVEQDFYFAPGQGNRPGNPSVHAVVPPPSNAVFKQNEDTYGIFRTHKTRSLKQVMLRTKYKGRDRTYYQAFDSEQEMMRWVDCLCLVLGLKENDGVHLIEPQHGTQSTVVAQPVEILQSVPRIQTPQQASPQTSSQLQPSPQSGTRPITGSSPNMAPHSQSSNQLGVQGSIKTQHSPSISKAEPRKSEVYFPLEDSYTGERLSTDQDQIGGGMALSDKDADHRASLDSIPIEPPPAPPKKENNSGPELQQQVPALDLSFYDNPKKSYISLDDNEHVYKIPHGDGVTFEGICKIPRGEEEGIYKVPHANNSYEEGIYKATLVLDDAQKSYNGICKVRAGARNKQPTRKEPPDVYSSVPIPVQGVPGGVFQESQLRPVSEDLCDIPPTQAPPRPTADKSHCSSLSSIDSHDSHGVHGDQNEVYVTPKHLNQGHTQPNTQTQYRTNTIGGASIQDVYDAPKSFWKVSSENNILGSVVPHPDTTYVAAGTGQVPIIYENIPPEKQTLWSSHLNSHPQPPSVATNTNSYVQDIYNRPPRQAQHVSNKLVKSLPLPKDCNQPSPRHSYINMPHDKHDQPVLPNGRQTESFYMSMSDSQEMRASKLHEAKLSGAGAGTGMGQVYADMKSVEQDFYFAPGQGNRPGNPSVHAVVPPPSKNKAFLVTPNAVFEQSGDTYDIFPTHRTRSFKHPISHDVLIAKKLALPSIDSSSDEETNSGDSHDKSDSMQSYGAMTSTHSVLLPHSIGLNFTPPPPKSPNEVRYLDLALDEHTDKEKSPLCTRAPTAGNISPTDYKEIDFVKTVALNETQKDLERKRKSSQRSVDE